MAAPKPTTDYYLFDAPAPVADDFNAAASEPWETVGGGGTPQAVPTATAAAAAPAAAPATFKAVSPALAPLGIDPFAQSVFPESPLDQAAQPAPVARQQSQRQAQQQQQQQQLGTPASSAEAGQASPAPDLPPRKLCSVTGCERDRFARGYCALHLSEATSHSSAVAPGSLPTPTTRIRHTYNLWSKSTSVDAESQTTECTWRLTYDDGEHTVVLYDNPFLGVRAVTINGREVYNATPDLGSWKLDATIGHSFKDSINIKVVVSASSKGYAYECYVDDLAFDDAHAAFLSKLSGASMLQRLQLSESRGDAQALEHLRGQQLQESIYIRENWSERTDEAKTAMGYLKSRVNWSFTISGARHELCLEYSAGSGKRKVILDGTVIAEEKPSLISLNKHKKFDFKFRVDGVDCQVTAEKNHSGVRDPRDDPAAPPRPFLFNFFIDSVPFEACTQTESDLAGGNISIDTEAQAVAVAAAPNSGGSSSSRRSSGSGGGSASAVSPAPVVQSGRRYSVHKPLTAAEYEAALHEANERERAEEEAAKEARRAAKEKEDAQHHHHHHRKNSADSQSRA